MKHLVASTRAIAARSSSQIIPALVLSLFATIQISGQAQTVRSAFPIMNVPDRIKGEEAIAALGNQITNVAAFYRKSPDEIRDMLRRDDSLALDRDGRLFYVCNWQAPTDSVSEKTNAAPIIQQFLPADQTFLLHSKPGATKTIFLDFDGHIISGTAWNDTENGGADIAAPAWNTDGNPASFGAGELTAIQQVWLRVAEDFAPYDVDVTTEYPGEAALTRGSGGDQAYGVRALVSAIGDYFGDPGGLAYVGVFDNTGDYYKPALVFPENLGNSEKNIAEAISHEVGHTLGLSHDGIVNGASYYQGQGNWAPIMGVAYSKAISQWSKGEYANANNGEDDLTVITLNGLPYRTDSFGNTTAAATALAGSLINTNGFIETTGDKDFFSFQSGAGLIQITVTPAERGANLHLLVSLYNGLGTLITNRQVADTSSGMQTVSIQRTLNTGNYFVSIEGAGSGDPMTTGYSSYASLGQYSLSLALPGMSGWLPDAAGPFSWDDPANWSSGVPNTADANASITNNITGDQTITLDAAITIGRLLLGDAGQSHGFTIQDGSGGPLNFATTGGDAFIIKSAGADDAITASIALQTDLEVANTSPANLTLGGFVTGNNSLIKSGVGLLTLAGTNLSMGNTIVSNGTLALAATGAISNNAALDVKSGAVLDVSALAGSFSIISNQTLSGSGSGSGDATVNEGGIVAPGSADAFGTLTFSNNLVLPGGANLAFDLGSADTINGGTNDLIAVAGNLSLAGTNTITINPPGGLLASPGSYVILSFGALSGSAANLVVSNTTRYSIALDDSVSGQISLNVTGNPTNLIWLGDGSLNRWDIAGGSNWLNDGVADQFLQFDTVTFDNSGSNNTPINLVGAISPGAVTVNAEKNYTFAGPGKLTGATSLTKLGDGTLILNNANDFTGTVTVGGFGVLKPAMTNALGSSSGATVIQNTGVLDLNGLNLGGEPVIVEGFGTTKGAIINNGAAQLNALRFVTLSGDTTFGGSNRWDIRANPTASLAGNGFKLSKTGTNEVWLVGLGDTALGDIEVKQGLLGIQSSTTLGIASDTLTLWPGSALAFWDNTTNVLSKILRLTNSVVRSDSGNNVFAGEVTLNASNLFSVGGGLEMRSPISGGGSLAKAGSGTLTLKESNSFTGTLWMDTSSASANDGVVKLARGNALANAASVVIRNNNGGSSTLQLDGSSGNIALASAFRINCRNNTSAAIQNLAGSNTISGLIQLDIGGNTVMFLSDAGTLHINGTNQYVGSSTGARTYTFTGSGNHIVSKPILNSVNGAPIRMAKSGTGALTLNTASSYAGGTTLSQGILQVNSNNAFGTGAIICNSGANTARIILGNGVTITNTIIATNVNPGASLGLVMAANNTTATFSGPITFNANATAGGHFAGPTTSGLLNITGRVSSGATNFLVVRLGNVRFSGGGSYPEIQPRANTTSLGANNGIATNSVMDIGGNGSPQTPTSFDLNGFDQTLAGLKNAVTPNYAAWVTNSAATTNTLTLKVGAANQSFGGSIVGNIGLTLDSGTQTLMSSGPALNGLYAFSGDTTINGGRLILGAGITLPNTPVIKIGAGGVLDVSASGLTLGGSQTIQGNGSVAGNVAVNGTISPGASIGALTFSNSLTLSAASTTLMEITHAGPTNDVIASSNPIMLGGALVVSKLGSSLAAGDVFKLFSAPSLNGSFSNISLPATPAGTRWDTSQLTTDGTISMSAVPPPEILVSSLTGTNLALQFLSESDVSYILEAATNLLSPVLWQEVSTNIGSGSLINLLAPIDASEPQRFYRVRAE